MTRRPIGYYVHHQGAGHLARARVIRDAIHWPLALLGTGIGAEGIDLPDDRIADAFDGADAADGRPDALHYAPLDHDGIRRRVAAIAWWIADARPALMIVDVSVEVAMLARLASVPTLYVRLGGERTDPAHLEAFRGARALIAPFDALLEHSSTPDWVRAKTRYCPGLTAAAAAPPHASPRVLIVAGKGGGAADGERIAAAARACPDHQWRAIGPVERPGHCPANLILAGWTDQPEAEIAQASVVVGAAGDGLVNAVLAADRPFVCIPEARAFGEQRATAMRLGQLGVAIFRETWPAPEAWPALLAEAQSLDPAGRGMMTDRQGPQKLARWLEATAMRATDPGLVAA